MARLAITKGVLAEYAKLDKGVQNAVEAAITEFAKDPNPGSQLEKVPYSRDGRIRTIRVDGVWRGVVLAPDGGDTYCLLTVLPQEKAIGYAASHRFSVNPSTGMLEMSNEDSDPATAAPPCRPLLARRTGGCSPTSATLT